MNRKTLAKIFPLKNCDNIENLQIDKEGLWSITHPKDADYISEEIANYIGKEKIIIDMTAGCGGNLLSFSKFFKMTIGIESDIVRYNYLNNNIKNYKYTNVKIYHDSCLNYLNYDADIYFFDPPWGGPNYKNTNNIILKLDDILLEDIISQIKNKLIILKLPFNYGNKLKNIKKTISLGNILIIFILNSFV